MSIAIEKWFANLREGELLKNNSPTLPRVDEISEAPINRMYEYFAENGNKIQTEFDGLFDGAMRKVISLGSRDASKLLEIVGALKQEDWVPDFSSKTVKQVKQRLRGGGQYTEDREVVELNLKKEFDYEIPVGPRKGDVIKKTDRTKMTRAIAKLSKNGRLTDDLKEWWDSKVTYFTNDPESAKKIERAFLGDPMYKQQIIVSRHPVDVLRMGEVGTGVEKTCHAEGFSFFDCAVEESKGNGLIAYLVDSAKLQGFLRGEQGQWVAAEEYIKEQFLDYTMRWETIYEKYTELIDYIEKYTTFAIPPDWEDVEKLGALAAEDPKDGVQEGGDEIYDLMYISQTIKWMIGMVKEGDEDFSDLEGAERKLITDRAVIDAVVAKAEGKEWRLLPKDAETEVKSLGDFDEKEIFADNDRNVPGLRASSRLRLRKFYDKATKTFFTVPESRLYGGQSDTFRQAVKEWAWDTQKQNFTVPPSDMEDAPPDEEETLWLPEPQDLVRYGGSYSDTEDGVMLNNFFSLSGKKIKIYQGKVGRAFSGDDGRTTMEDELAEEVNTLNNNSSNLNFEAYLSAGADPHVIGTVSFYFEFDIGWDGSTFSGSRDYYLSNYWTWKEEGLPDGPERKIIKPTADLAAEDKLRDKFEDTLSRVTHRFDIHDGGDHERIDTAWRILNFGNRKQTLRLEFEIEFGPHVAGGNPGLVEDYTRWAVALEGMLGEQQYYEIAHTAIRRLLVGEGMIAKNEFDLFHTEFIEASKSLKNWVYYGFTQEDGELDQEDEISFAFSPGGGGWGKVELGPFPRGLMSFSALTSNVLIGGANDVYTPLLHAIGEGGTKKRVGDDRWAMGGSGESIIPSPSFKNVLEKNLKPLLDAANVRGAERGGTTKDLLDIKNAKIRLYAEKEKKTRRNSPINVLFSFVYGVDADTNREEATSMLEAMKFIDRYPEQLKKAFQDAYEFFTQRALGFLEAREKLVLDGSLAIEDINELTRQHSSRALRGDISSEGIMNVIMFVRQNWKIFEKPERYYVTNMLANLGRQRTVPWDDSLGLPRDWDNEVKKYMGLLGVGKLRGMDVKTYKWDGPSISTPDPKTMLDLKPSGRPSRPLSDRAKWIAKNLHKSDSEAIDMDREIMNFPLQLQAALANAMRNGNTERFNELYGDSFIYLFEGKGKKLKEVGGSREPIDLRIYKVSLGCIVNLDEAGIDSQIENQIRGIEEVTTVSHIAKMQQKVGERRFYRVYEVKFELYGQQARDTYRDSILVPAVNREVKGVKVIERGPVEMTKSKLTEWGGLGYSAPPYDHYMPQMVTPRISLDSVVQDWAEGGVQIYDTPMNTNQMQYHVMMPVDELWGHAARFYRGSKTDFDGRYKHFIKDGPQMPVYVALGQNGRVKITGNEDLVWFAKQSGLEELPVFFSYQKQV